MPIRQFDGALSYTLHASATSNHQRSPQKKVAPSSDGPFAETKEQLAGYYILECENLDEAIDWAARIPTGCKGAPGCIEIRPLPGLSAVPHDG